jgi:hypothetical protein
VPFEGEAARRPSVRSPSAPRIRRASAPAAHRVVVADGEDLRLQLYRGDECLGDMPLGPADAATLASELLNAGKRRMGRA